MSDMTTIHTGAVLPSTAMAAMSSGNIVAKDGSDHLEVLLHVQNQVLEHILDGTDLAVTLGRIAEIASQLAAPAHGLLLWSEGDPSGPIRLVSPDLRADLAELWRRQDRLDDELDSVLERFLRACAEAGWTAIRRRIQGQTGASVAALVLLDHRPPGLDRAQQYALETLALLARSAIEGERRRAALQTATERLAAIAKTIPGVIYQRVVKPDGTIRYTYISEAARELFGVEPSEIIADPQALFDCHGPEYYATFRERLLAASRSLSIWDVEATIITRDGKRKYTHALARPHRLPDGSVVWDGVILDATRIKEAELAAAAAESRTRTAIIESIPHGFALFDPAGRLVTWNRRLLDLCSTSTLRSPRRSVRSSPTPTSSVPRSPAVSILCRPTATPRCGFITAWPNIGKATP